MNEQQLSAVEAAVASAFSRWLAEGHWGETPGHMDREFRRIVRDNLLLLNASIFARNPANT